MRPTSQPLRHRVVVLGGGFAGLTAARGLARAPVEVTLVDAKNHHLFQPLLYQVATGGLSPANIAAPLRSVLSRQKNARVLLGHAREVDVAGRSVHLDVGSLSYDTLIVATGVRHHYFGRPEWEAHAPGLKTVEDATEIRGRILEAFERAELAENPAQRAALLTFVVVGAGPTGVELAGAIGEMARTTLREDFRSFDPASARVVLVEAGERVLSAYHPQLGERARRHLARLGVETRTGALVTDLDADGVTLGEGQGAQRIDAATVIWAAGVRASALAEGLAAATGAETDRAGCLLVEPDCTLPGHPEILVLGDLCNLRDAEGERLPGTAPVAMQMGRHAARLLRRRLDGKPAEPFRYRDKGSLAVIGRAAAVAELGRLRFSGAAAWLLWLFIHILYLVGFTNRVVVLVEWAHAYFTRGRGARLITNRPEDDEVEAD